MKKILAYSFLLLGFCIFLPSNFLHAQIPTENLIQGQILKLEKPGYYNSRRALVKNPSDIFNQIYYKTDGKVIYTYNLGEDGVADIVDVTGKASDDRIVQAHYLYGNNKEAIGEIDIPAQEEGEDLLTARKKFEYDTAVRFGFQGSATNADEYQKQFNTLVNKESFAKNTSTGEDATARESSTDRARVLAADIKAHEKELKELEKDPNKNASEISRVEEAINEAQKELDNINKQRNELGKQVAANYKQGVAQDRAKVQSQAKFPGLELCGTALYNAANSSEHTDGSVKECLGAIVNLGLVTVTAPFSWSADLLDKVTRITVSDFGVWFSNGGQLYKPVNNIWQLIKNICNLFFITALIYIAIKTIIQADGFQEKDRLKNVIIFAFLINFSMFFTKIMIDVSNTASLQVFNVITQSKDAYTGNTSVIALNESTTKEIGISKETTLADVFLANMQIQRFVLKMDPGTYGAGTPYRSAYESTQENIIIYGIFAIIFLLAATIVIAAIAGMITIRFVMLVLLLMTSPLAYIGSFVPSVIGTYSQLWWDKFKQNLVFLPVLMIMFYITMTFSQFASTQVGSGDYVSLIFSYVITIAMLVISLSVAQMTGGSAATASWGTKWAKGAIGGMTVGVAARLGRRTIGAAGSGLANSNTLKRFANSNNLLARMSGVSALARGTMKGGEKLQDATFDARNTALGKSVGVEGLKDGYKKGVKEVKEQEAKDRLEAAKKSFELSAIDKAKADERVELHDQSVRAEKRKEEAEAAKLKVDEEISEFMRKLSGVADDIDEKILKEKQDITKEITENEKEVTRLNTASTTRALTPEEAAELANRNTRSTELAIKRSTIGNDRTARVEAETERLNKLLDKASKDHGKFVENLVNADKGVIDAQNRIKDRGFDPAKLKEKVKKDKDDAKERSKNYLDYLENNARKGFMDAEIPFISNPGIEKHREELIKELKNLYKSKEDDEMKKLLAAIKERTKDEEKK